MSWMRHPFVLWLWLWTLASRAQAGSIDTAALKAALAKVKAFDGRVGACIQAGKETVCFRGEERFSLQSVVKLMVGFAVLDAVDTKRQRLDGAVTVRTQDLSVFVQPIAELVGRS